MKRFQALIFSLLAISVICQSERRIDYNTYSNYESAVTKHFHLDWDLDFTVQKINGSINLNMRTLKETNVIELDFWNLKLETGNPCYLTTGKDTRAVHCIVKPQKEDQGDQLSIDVSTGKTPLGKDVDFNLTIYYSMDNQSVAASFLTPEQTSSKVQPYLFTQCEPIYCRSIAPLQDTPSVKSTYTATVRTDKSISNVYMSAGTKERKVVGNQIQYQFEMFNPIPSYLVAIVAGNVQEKKVGNRTYVVAEPNDLDLASKELEDLEKYLGTIETYVQIEYSWKFYTIVIMPPSFPFGGMENPLLTFASPSIITKNGDKTGVTVAVHEIAHSWTGNTVTCGNWSNMWLNEGFTVFLERHADIELFGLDFYKVDAINGNDSMVTDMGKFGWNNSYSSLFPLTKGANPDDSFSTIPYEKGFQLLTWIEILIGKDKMRQLITTWVKNQTFQSAFYQDFQEVFVDFVRKNIPNPDAIIAQVDFDLWVRQPGLPPKQSNLTQWFDTPLIAEANSLAEQFIQLQGQQRPAKWEDFKKWNVNLQYIFLNYFFNSKQKLNQKLMVLLDQCYNFTNNGNYEILWRWYRAVIYTKYESQITMVIQNYLGSIGRQKMVLPLYTAYMAVGDQALARAVYQKNKDFYHPIARRSIESVIYPKIVGFLREFILQK